MCAAAESGGSGVAFVSFLCPFSAFSTLRKYIERPFAALCGEEWFLVFFFAGEVLSGIAVWPSSAFVVVFGKTKRSIGHLGCFRNGRKAETKKESQVSVENQCSMHALV